MAGGERNASTRWHDVLAAADAAIAADASWDLGDDNEKIEAAIAEWDDQVDLLVELLTEPGAASLRQLVTEYLAATEGRTN